MVVSRALTVGDLRALSPTYSGDEEAVLVVLAGRCSILVGGSEPARWESLGGRTDVFSGPTVAVYAPRHSGLGVAAASNLELAIAKAPCDVDLPPALIMPKDIRELSSGMSSWRRDVRLVVPPGSPVSQRLIVGETINPPGKWSGIPPHKHDEITDDENLLEEFYLFKTQPADGFVVQLAYRDDREQAQLVGNDDVMLFPAGYHPTIAAPGVTGYYLWALSGESKAYEVTIDPRFNWVASTEAVLKEMRRG